MAETYNSGNNGNNKADMLEKDICQILRTKTLPKNKTGWSRVEEQEQKWNKKMGSIEGILRKIEAEDVENSLQSTMHYITDKSAKKRLAGAKILVGVLPYFPYAMPTIIGFYYDEKDEDVRKLLFGAVARSALVYWTREQEALTKADKKCLFELIYMGLKDKNPGVNEVALTSLDTFTPIDEFFGIEGESYKESINSKVEEVLFRPENPKLRQLAATILPKLKGEGAIPLLVRAQEEEIDFKVKINLLTSLSNLVVELENSERGNWFIGYIEKIISSAEKRGDSELAGAASSIKFSFMTDFEY